MMYLPLEEFLSPEYIQTSGGNVISRKAKICRPQSVEIPQGRIIIKDNVIIRGDLCTIQINKYTIINESCVLRPSYAIINENFRFINLTIGSHCYIGENSIIEAAVIGTGCYIGHNCILSKRCVLKDFVYIEANTIVPPDMTIPPFSIVSGRPGKIIGEMPESTSTLGVSDAVSRYKNMIPTTTN